MSTIDWWHFSCCNWLELTRLRSCTFLVGLYWTVFWKLVALLVADINLGCVDDGEGSLMEVSVYQAKACVGVQRAQS